MGLKLKLLKCSFFQKELQYLGHLVSDEGVWPLPEKLESIQNMPAPRNAKEVKQFLGLVVYYKKFIPRFSDITCPLSKLMAKDQVFKWTEPCQAAFEMLKDKLCHEPILKYPDTSEPYTLFTDASNYSWAGVLTQEYKPTDIKGNECTTLHPVAYVSRLFRGIQLNWAVLTKEAYAIYMCVKRLMFYISGMKVTLQSDHLPLKKFLLKNTLNDCINRWAMEIKDYQIDFNHIEGKNNVLVDTLSRLISIDPKVELNPEFTNYEFGQYCFKELPKARTKVDQKLGNTSSEGDMVEINKIKVIYDEEIDHESKYMCTYHYQMKI